MSDGSQVDASTLCVEQNDPFPATPPPQPPAVADRSDKSTLANRKETRVDLPATGGQDLIDSRLCADDDAAFHLDKPPPAHGFDYLRIEEARQRHPARLRHRASGLALRWLHPVPEMGRDGHEIMRVAIADKKWHTAGSDQLRELMQHGLCHRQRALTHLHTQQQLTLGIDRRPHPVRGPRETLNRLAFTQITVSDRTEHGVQFVELDLIEV